ncbi:MAG: hypothetical protein HXX08_06955 [Chloroflexi bacterium]|uniref:Uncharacterized protein n=1 Tax=Candidatus Chlorohelix allophototropha TaxID=3003348 RepID=A0A8T7M0Y3_9CHLR|nr:hypothetical protein [Chloroflexota bacterium]WJW67473.1 hypothetical protein OZ401_000739 [Chloroflexota bacterium L227-S17]
MGSTYAITQVNTLEAENALDRFIKGDLQDAIDHIQQINASVYYSCRLDNLESKGRRIMIVADANEDLVRICIEASYELYEGDTHFFVERIGTSNRSEARERVPNLMQRAYDRLITWKPSHDNIWDNVY